MNPKQKLSKMPHRPNLVASHRMVKSDRPLSHIPWQDMRKRITHSILPEIVCRNTSKDKQQFRVALSNSIPIYLPAKYHQMRCDFPESAKLTEAVKEQWDAAFEFVHTCSTYDHNYMATVLCDAIDGETRLLHPMPVKIVANSQVQQCQSAAEFLLEPWVLIQMPFQPALLHQWAVALLAETLTFQKKIAPIFSYGCPKKYAHIFEHLREMAVRMLHGAYVSLSMYTVMCLSALENNFHSILNMNIDEFLHKYLVNFLPTVEFVTSDQTNSVIWSIEQLVLEELNAGGEANAPQVVFVDVDEQTMPLYDYWYWTNDECELREFTEGAKSGERGRSNKVLLMDLPTYYKHRCASKCGCLHIHSLMLEICRELLRTKRLAGVDLDTVMEAIEHHIPTDFYLLHVVNLDQFSHKTKNGKEEDGFGALNNIMCLYAEAKVAENFDLLTRRIFNIVKKLHPEVTIGNSTESRPTTEYALPAIESKFQQILANKDEKWTWENILADAKIACGSLDKISTADIDKRPAKVVQHFQTRIRNLVHKIAEKHLSSLKAGRFEFFPEQQFVQYLLPFFVNCFLSPLADLSKYQIAVKRKCVRFVEKLICSYEQHEYSQVLSTEKKVTILNREAININASFKLHVFASKIACYLNDKVATEDIISSIKYFLFHYAQNESHGEYSKWFIQIDMFMNRAMNVLNCYVFNFEDGGQREPSILSRSISTAFSCKDENSISALPIYNLYKQLLFKMKPNMAAAPDLTGLEQSEVISLVPKKILKSSQELSCQQLAALFVFLHFGNLDLHLNSQWKESELQGPGFPFDMSSVFAWCIATKDTWKIKQLVAPMLMTKSRRGDQLKDNSFVSLDVAKSNHCYIKVQRKISSDGTKVLMKEKGEITFVPVKHCRWCGLIKVEKLRLCSLCEENSDYCDVNYFCSEKCELEALKSKHREEHARYFVVKLGMEKMY